MPGYICHLNQVAMLEGLAKLPVALFIFSSLALAGLLLYIVLFSLSDSTDKLRYPALSHAAVMFSIGCLVWSWLISIVVTFRISESAWKSAEVVAFVLLFGWGVGLIYKWRKSIMRFIKREEE